MCDKLLLNNCLVVKCSPYCLFLLSFVKIISGFCHGDSRDGLGWLLRGSGGDGMISKLLLGWVGDGEKNCGDSRGWVQISVPIQLSSL